MANPTQPTRLSPAELRRRLLAPPTDSSAAPIVPEDTPTPPSQRRDAGRFGGATQTAIDLDSLMADMSVPPNSKLTPAPEARLDPSQFRSIERTTDPVQAARPAGSGYPGVLPIPGDEVSLLRIQNSELTRIIEEMKPLLEEATAQEGRTQAREKEFQDQLIERDLRVEELEAKLKESEEKLASIPPPKTPKTRDELEEWSDELEQESAKLNKLRHELEDDRKQLHEDEESLEKQMREMECAMARERAMMARQETELKRLSAEIQHELELLQRGDGTLREQLSKFQRRHQEVLSRNAGGGSPPPVVQTAEPIPPTYATLVPTGKKDSGLLRRIFRGNK
jgi:hypothetical protein